MVQIKPLEWEEIHYNRSNEEPIPELTGWYAETEVGSYYVMLEARIEVTLDGFQFHKVGSFDEPDPAFAAAQADYERRILSTLVPTSPESRCEELVKALQEAEPVAWRFRYDDGKWNVQKNKPAWYRDFMADVEIEPLFSLSSYRKASDDLKEAEGVRE